LLLVVAAGFAAAPGDAFAQADAGVDAGVTHSADAPLADEGEPSELRITEVRVEGNRRVEPEAVKRAMVNREGRAFDATLTGADLRALWSLGYFSDIQLLVQRLPKGGVVYVVRLEERPAVREVRITGNDELSKDDFKDTIDIKPHSVLDLDAIRRNEKKIQEKYVEKGYFLAEVTHRVEPVAGAQEVDVVFAIREHAKVMVKQISFLGVNKVPPDELKAVMGTKEGGYLSFLTQEGTYREEAFQRDLAIIQSAYYDRGFINVKVEKPWVSISSDKRYIFITVKVEEGEPYTIGKIDYSGDLLDSKEALGRRMGSHAGELFNRTKLSKDILTLTDVYYDDGYAYANITPVTQVNADAKTIDLTFDVAKGQQVSIERIDITGNTKTRDKVIRRELRVYEGDLFSGTGLRKSKERVTALGFFETVEVTHKPGSDNAHVVVQVEIKEKATGTFQVGLGFSNVENFIFTAQIAQQNFLGWGQSVSASAQLSTLRNFIQLSFVDPYFFDTNYIFSADFYKMQADYFGFVRNATGGDVNLGYHVLEDVMVSLTYTREYVQIEPGQSQTEITLANQFTSGQTSSLRLSATWDKRDNRLFPTSGFMNFASAEFAPKLLGGDFLFARYSAYSRWYFPLFWGIVFKTNATVGLIQQLDPNGHPLPMSEFYYLGGINSVRGYVLRTISPSKLVASRIDPSSTVGSFHVGGDKQAYFNFELEFPIFEKVGIRGVLFYDAGNAYAPNSPFFTDRDHDLPLGLFHSVGFGFRWFSPIGPLRFEWGIPLNRRPEDTQPVVFEFTIGNFF
jgi:outer membrane protein insertion porin family